MIVVEVLPSAFYTDEPSPIAGEIDRKLSQAVWYTRMEGRALIYFSGFRLTADGGATVPLLKERFRLALEGPVAEEGEPASAAMVEHADGWHEIVPNAALLLSAAETSDLTAQKIRQSARPDAGGRWSGLLEELTELDRRAGEQGATLVFVRFPSGEPFASVEAEVYPDGSYWDRLAHTFPGRAWHFRDAPELRDLRLYDGSHLISEDARRFSRWLGRRIRPLLEP